MDGAVDATAAHQRRVRGIDDSVDVLLGDVPQDQRDLHQPSLAAASGQAYPQPPEALALVLHLHDVDRTDLLRRRDVSAPVRLRVETDDVDDAYFGQVGRQQVRRRTNDVGDRERVVTGQHLDVDAPVRRDLLGTCL